MEARGALRGIGQIEARYRFNMVDVPTVLSAVQPRHAGLELRFDMSKKFRRTTSY
jgi:hypothetical protein